MNLDNWLKNNSFDAFLLHGTSSDADLYYLTKFKTSDPVNLAFLNNQKHLFVPKMEVSRGRKESVADKIYPGSFEDVRTLLKEQNASKIAVPESFPSGLLKQLEKNFEVAVVKSPVEENRQTKNKEEIKRLRSAQRTTEKAMKHAKKIIQESEIRENRLYWKNKVLTSERLRQKIQIFLLENGCQNILEPIAACGEDSADPHVLGEGVLRPEEPIIVDIFPRKDMYFGDMTRTFVKGRNTRAEKMYDAVKEAQDAALKKIKTGVEASEVHKAAAEALDRHGFETSDSEGFIHSTGHGVGLDLHEAPRLAEGNHDKLKEGEVITVEPGLYYSNTGGVRIENMVMVTDNGYEDFNKMDREIVLD